MKKPILKFGALMVLLTAIFLINDSSPVHASTCWQDAISTWNNCDAQYSQIRATYDDAPNTCDAQAYAACNSRTNGCYLTYMQDCMEDAQAVYDQRGSTYATCMGFGGNGGNCVYELDFSCQDAQLRAFSCSQLFVDPEDWDAWNTCYQNSGYGSCV